MSPDGRAALQRADQLFQAGCELFAERGYHDVDVTDLTEHIGVSSGTFYNYYPNKRALLEAIMRTQFNAYAAMINPTEATTNTRKEFIAAFEHMTRRILTHIAENPPLSSFLALTAPGVDREAYVLASQAFSTFSTRFADFFHHGRTRGWVRDDLDIVVVGRATASCLITAAFPLLLGDAAELDVDEVSRVVATYLLGGMRNA
jgi:AcrR family transcriptional regulator